ncbi:MAG: cytochrome c oxidase assembly protein [Longimicrobiales bacterium]
MFASLALLHGNGDFSWTRFPVHVSTLIGCLALAGGYLYAVGPLRRRHQLAERTDSLQTAFFLTGLAILFISLNGPIHELSDFYLFSAHMVQHLLLTLIMPPLLLIGLPAWLVQPLLRRPLLAATMRVLTSPLVAFGIYNVVFAGWHLPQFYNWALENHNVHIVQHLMFIGAALLVWWPVVDPVPELQRMTSPARMLYLFALGIPMSVVSALITLSADVLYAWYSEAPRVFRLSALDDQQMGGLIMWVPGMMVYWVAITILFFRWSNREERDEWRERAMLAAGQ